MTTAAVLEALIAARAKIERPEHWVQARLASAPDAYATSPTDPHATCFCALGAVMSLRLPVQIEADVLKMLERPLRFSLGDYNDTHSHADVLKLFDKAIERAKQP